MKSSTTLIILLLSIASTTWAQSNGTNSSYSRYGLGLMDAQSQGFNKGMGGVAMGIRSGQKVNTLNPAAYSAIDSLSFIMDVGMGLTYGHYKQDPGSANVRNAQLEYVNAGFHVAKRMGMAIGYRPFSHIGYNFANKSNVSGKTTTKTTYYGNSGLHELFIGAGWNPFDKLSIGANVSFLWGEYSNSLSQVFYENGTSQTNYSTQHQEIEASIRNYRIEVGAQYPIRLTKKDWLTLGATVGLGHKIGTDATLNRYTSEGDTIQMKASNAFELPYTYTAGLAWTHEGRITIAADYSNERWEGCKLPVATTGTTLTFEPNTDNYINRQRFNVGAEYCQNPTGRKYGERIRYRIGGNYITSNVKVNGYDGPKEYHLTTGVALPLNNSSKSLINVSAEWMCRKAPAKTLITENYIMLHLGITFNESWFMKWKIN